MTGLGIVIPRAGLGPIIDPLPSVGVDGYTHRYAASRVDGAHGADVTNWPDAGMSPNAITAAAAASNTLDLTTGPYPFVIAASATSALVNTANETSPWSFALIAKKTATGSQLFSAGGMTLTREAGGGFQLAAGSGTPIVVAGSSDWECIVGTCLSSSGTSRLSVGSATGTSTLTQSASNPSSIVRGGSGNDTRVVELVIWSGTALDATQHTDVLAAMQAAYPSLAL